MKVDWKFVFVAASAAAPAIQADKDNSYYPGFTNPNVNREMYWKDSFNVLQDLDEFDALYIKYHGCVWSPYGNGDNACGVAEYGYDGDNQDDDGDNQEGDEDDEGEYNWYQGKANCYRANVAYTLYGQLKGGSFSGCNKRTFINSFFTTYGVDTFAEAFGIGTYYANSYCYASDDAGRRGRNLEDGDSSDGGSNDGDLSNNEMFYQDVTSTGTGCSSDGTFVIDYFQGAYCDGSHYQATTDTLDDFNDLVEDLNCVQIYSADDGYEEEEYADEEEEDGYDEDEYVENAYDDGDYRDRALEDNGAYYEDNEDYEENSNSEEYGENDDEKSVVYQVLGYSRACSIMEYPDDCPDPYGLVNKYTNNLQGAARWHSEKARNTTRFIFSSVLFISGLCMILYVRFTKKLTKKFRKKAKSGRKKRANHVPEPSIDEDSYSDDQLTNFTRSVSSSFQSVKRSIQEYAEEAQTSSSSSDGSKEAMLPIAKAKNSPKKEPSSQSKNANANVTDDAAPSKAVNKTDIEVYDDTDTADAMLNERGKATAAEENHKTSGSNAKKRYKRPVMARLSKKLFRSSKAKPST